MEAKRNGRMTIKNLSEELHKEFKSLKETVTILENRLQESEKKVQCLEEKIECTEGAVQDVKECFKCNDKFTNISELNKHVQIRHPRTFGCNRCDKKFVKRFELETHLKDHTNAETFKCDQCGKSFLLKWRLKKHEEIHGTKSQKFCHYFNNEKNCPYEEIGCKFRHQHSQKCRFNENCNFKLCQFKHEENQTSENLEVINKDVDKEVVENENVDDKVRYLSQEFEKLSEMEKFEAKELLCDVYCKASYGYHRCSDINDEGFVGCDVMNITDDYENEDENGEGVVRYFPCEQCEEKFEDFDKFNEHFDSLHTPEVVKCMFSECQFAAKTVNLLTMHIGVNHNDLIQKRL